MKCKSGISSALYLHLKSLNAIFHDKNTIAILQTFIEKDKLTRATQTINDTYNNYLKKHYFPAKELGSLLSLKKVLGSFITQEGKGIYESGYILNIRFYLTKMLPFIAYLKAKHLGNPGNQPFVNFDKIQYAFSNIESISLDNQFLRDLEEQFYEMIRSITPFYKYSEKLGQMFKEYSNYLEIALHELIYILSLFDIVSDFEQILDSLDENSFGETGQIFSKKTLS